MIISKVFAKKRKNENFMFFLPWKKIISGNFLKLVLINCTTHRDAQDDRFWEKVEEKIRAK